MEMCSTSLLFRLCDLYWQVLCAATYCGCCYIQSKCCWCAVSWCVLQCPCIGGHAILYILIRCLIVACAHTHTHSHTDRVQPKCACEFGLDFRVVWRTLYAFAGLAVKKLYNIKCISLWCVQKLYNLHDAMYRKCEPIIMECGEING